MHHQRMNHVSNARLLGPNRSLANDLIKPKSPGHALGILSVEPRMHGCNACTATSVPPKRRCDAMPEEPTLSKQGNTERHMYCRASQVSHA